MARTRGYNTCKRVDWYEWTTSGQSLEGVGHGARDQACVTEHFVGASRWDGSGTPGTEIGKRGYVGAPLDKANEWNTHPVWYRLRRMGNVGGEWTSERSCGGLKEGGRVAV